MKKKPTPPKAPEARTIVENGINFRVMRDIFKPLWKRKEEVTSGIGGLPMISVPIPIPPRKIFITMAGLLSDAEKYDSEGESEVSKQTLSTLVDYINDHIDKIK